MEILLFVFFAGLITGGIEALIARIWNRSWQLCLLMISGAILGTGLNYFLILINPKIFNAIVVALWPYLGPPIGAGNSPGADFRALGMMLVTMFLTILVSGSLGGLLGLGSGLTFLRIIGSHVPTVRQKAGRRHR
jgi:hypothetical protein